MENNGIIKYMLIVLVALYVISPVDLVPGPIDDLLLILLSVAANRHPSVNGSRISDDSVDASWKE